MGMGVGKGNGNGNGDGNDNRNRNGKGNGNKLLTIFYIFMSQILYVPCKCHGDVYVSIEKSTLEM
jgi:hypothetical protein